MLGCEARQSTPNAKADPKPEAPATSLHTDAAQATAPPTEPVATNPANAVNIVADTPSQSPSETPSVSATATEPKDSQTAAVGEAESSQIKAATPAMPTTPAVPATWTSQRIVVLGKGGPRFLKLDVNVGHRDLEAGFQAALASVAAELQLNFAQPCGWNELLDKPLVASGWLGNLVPNSEQRQQLQGLYDSNKNEKVEEPEFRAFITRGLSRNPHFKLSSKRTTQALVPSKSIGDRSIRMKTAS